MALRRLVYVLAVMLGLVCRRLRLSIGLVRVLVETLLFGDLEQAF